MDRYEKFLRYLYEEEVKAGTKGPEKWLSGNLERRFDIIQDRVLFLHDTTVITPQVKWFTPHGESHYRAVQKLIELLLPCGKCDLLSDNERFFLLSSAWLHDVGMIKGILKGDDSKSDFQVRDEHHVRSERYIVRSYRTLGLKEFEAAAFGMLARFHRRRCQLSECPETLPVPNHGVLRLRLLAAYLRLADALHVDQTRAPANKYAIMMAYDIPTQSKLHWLKSKFVLGIDINPGKKLITVHFKRPKNVTDMLEDSLNEIYSHIVQDLTEELETVQNTLYMGGISYFLEIQKEAHEVELDEQLNRELTSVINSYSIIDNPSSSALCSLMLQSIWGIIEANDPIAPSEQKGQWRDSDNAKKGTKCCTSGGGNSKSGRGKPEGENSGSGCGREHPQTDWDRIVIKQIKSFLSEIKENVINSRNCHSGLKSLILKIGNIIDPENDTEKRKDVKSNQKKEATVANVRALIKTEIENLSHARRNIRHNAFLAYHENLSPERPGKSEIHPKISEKTYNILLYGYSELTIKTLCGFRDVVIKELLDDYKEELDRVLKGEMVYNENNIPKPFHKEGLEEKATKKFRIFVCEGQPKNKTGWRGRIIYHDGLRYAQSLEDHGFNEIYLIPDAIAASLIGGQLEKEDIAGYAYPGCSCDDSDWEHLPTVDYIIMGANGFNKKSFRHSAGHLMAVLVKKFVEEKNIGRVPAGQVCTSPKLVLSLITNKYKDSAKPPKEALKPRFSFRNDWIFRRGFSGENVRENIFISQDSEVRNTFKELNRSIGVRKNNVDEDNATFSFYNPREDTISIDHVDLVITEKAWLNNKEEWLNNLPGLNRKEKTNGKLSGWEIKTIQMGDGGQYTYGLSEGQGDTNTVSSYEATLSSDNSEEGKLDSASDSKASDAEK